MEILNQKVDNFIANINARCNTPARIYALCEDEDRILRVLSQPLANKWPTLDPEDFFCVDIGVSCTGGLELPDRPKHINGETEEHFSEKLLRWQTQYFEA